jgi:dethiobiotin synthetase
MRGLFVTATDTGVGKTILSASLLAALVDEGGPVRAHKPVLTGLDERSCRPRDHEVLAGVTGMAPEEVAPLRYGPAVSPHLAARLAGERILPAQLLASARAQPTSTLVVEGVGGLLTPLADEHTVADFAAALGLPVLIAARPGVGTINHTLLTIEAARGRALDVRAVVLTPWPRNPSQVLRSNRHTIARIAGIEVAALGWVRQPERASLARAGAALPYGRWLCEPAAGHTPSGRQSATQARAAPTIAPATMATSSALIR